MSYGTNDEFQALQVGLGPAENYSEVRFVRLQISISDLVEARQ
jgi:hypothetical protein